MLLARSALALRHLRPSIGFGLLGRGLRARRLLRSGRLGLGRRRTTFLGGGLARGGRRRLWVRDGAGFGVASRGTRFALALDGFGFGRHDYWVDGKWWVEKWEVG